MDLDHDQLPTPASASASRKKYEVFISFRGEDTRKNFTTHLHTALLQEKIETYIDDRLVRGDEIWPSLEDAIKDSQISIVIFSPNYASSSWCLDELVRILDCKEKNNQIVIPVFYDVKTSDVRKQQGSYGEAFVKLEERFSDKMIRKWRNALETTSNLSGYDASNTRNDIELIKTIVKDIMKKLNHSLPSSDHLKGLVGMENRIKEVESLLFTSSSHAHIIGIWGMGGLGKSTLAKAIFKQFCPQFDGNCFLANVREEMQRRGATYLQKLFFGELSKEKILDLENLQSIKQRLYRKRLLIVLDDVDDLKHYEDLDENWDWLNSESRVIITSRDQQVLRNINIGVKDIYNLKELNEVEALQLFYLYAFKSNFPAENYTKMSKGFVNYAQGVPLALKVLGSHLHTRREEEWKSAMDKLKKYPNKRIVDILKISFDGLDNKQKEIFLDIACFFQGTSKDFVKEILDDGGCFADVIRDLIDKSLIIVDNKNELRVHDLLQEMGWQIARGQCNTMFGKPSRLWTSDEICDILERNTGTATIEGIFLTEDDGVFKGKMNIDLKPDVFHNMPSLRLLKISSHRFKFHFSNGLYTLPDKLRYWYWDYYPLKSLGSDFIPRNLVSVCMFQSKLEKLWNEFQPGPVNLKYVDLSEAKKLNCLPDLSRANLKVLSLPLCTSLLELPPLRFGNVLDKLPEEETRIREKIYDKIVKCSRISLMDNTWISEIDNSILRLDFCNKLKTLSKMSGKIEYISLYSTAVEEFIDSSIGSHNNVFFLDVNKCECLKNLPSSISDFGSLEYLGMSGCLSIDKFPKLPKNLRGLDLSQTSIAQVFESSLECLPHLNILYMCNCTRLESLPTSICKLKSLKRLNLSGCSRLKSFPRILEPMDHLELLDLEKTGIKDIPWSIENLVMLETLNLSQCENLESVPTSICKLTSLKVLDLSFCPKLKSFPEILEPMETLRLLYLIGTGIKDIPLSIRNLVMLKSLWLSRCENLEHVPTDIIYNMCNLIQVDVSECPRLQSFPQYGLSSLPILDPSRSTIGRLPFCINQTLCEFECRGSCAGKNLFLYLKCVDGLDYNLWTYFTHCECMIFYIVHKNLMIQYFHSVVLLSTYVKQESRDTGISFCYSGNKIPYWFPIQSMEPLISVDLSPLRKTNFLGFALCMVVNFDRCFTGPDKLELDCECHFKTSCDEISHKYHWTLPRGDEARSDHDDSKLEKTILDRSSNLVVFIWHCHRSDCSISGHATIEFATFGNHIVKKCGIRPLFRQDAVQFDLTEHVASGNKNLGISASFVRGNNISSFSKEVDGSSSSIRS
ncbi:TIR-NBS-LRR-like protein [Trema orientale]|uniref:ADP-ribosyl cyclase/cyclic ADP-ribose hydrolase n=1 Tax=Trema orientale TaxID=63057 RepID=A0A2P5BB93_TREOI|nr:TIR-NBS-LRR-like protein [Trema orientale]